MGWTEFDHRGRTTAELMRQEFGEEFWAKIRATATTSGVFYAVLELPAEKDTGLVPDENGMIRTALVVLTKRGRERFRYKDMTETMGPVESTCPARLLDMLSPIRLPATESLHFAAEWRARCRANLAKRKSAVKLTEGLRVQHPEPLTFRNSAKLDTFTVRQIVHRGRKRTVFQGDDGGYYALTVEQRQHLTVVPSS